MRKGLRKQPKVKAAIVDKDILKSKSKKSTKKAKPTKKKK